MRVQPPAHSPLALSGVRSGVLAWWRDGAAADGLRERLLRRFEARAVHLTDSGTTALRLAIAGTCRGGDAAVALPAYSCYNVLTAANGVGAAPLLYDLDPRTLGPEPRSLEAALEAGARAVVAVHLYGVPVDMRAIGGAAARHGAIVIEDAAQGWGGALDGRPLGGHAPLSVLSFGRGKGITGGGGGALLARTDEAAELLREAGRGLAAPDRAVGPLLAATAQWALARPSVYGLPRGLPFLGLGETIYPEPWPPAPMARASAGIVLHGWERALEEARGRRARAARLLAAAGAGAVARAPRPPSGAEPGYLRLPLLVDPAARARWLRRAERLGVMPGYPKPLHRLEAFRGATGEERLEGAEHLAAALLTLPTHGLLSESDLDALCDLLSDASATGAGPA